MSTQNHFSRRDRERKELRLRILDAGRSLFTHGGEDALTLRRVAEMIEYSATAIYAHFPSKEALLLEICETELIILIRALQQAGRLPDSMARLKAVANAYLDFGLQHPANYRVLFMRDQAVHMDHKASSEPAVKTTAPAQNDAQSLTERDSGAAPTGEDKPSKIYDHIHQAVFKAMAAGCFKPEYRDVGLLSQALWSCLHGIVALHLVRAQHREVSWKPVQHLAELSLEAFLNGLAQPSHQSPPTWRR